MVVSMDKADRKRNLHSLVQTYRPTRHAAGSPLDTGDVRVVACGGEAKQVRGERNVRKGKRDIEYEC